jgi:hypothetical protein
MPEMITVAKEFLELADDIEILILYEYIFNCDQSDIELTENDYGNMFHQIDNLLTWDIAMGELTYLTDTLHIARELTLQRVYMDGEIFKFEFKGIIHDFENL